MGIIELKELLLSFENHKINEGHPERHSESWHCIDPTAALKNRLIK